MAEHRTQVPWMYRLVATVLRPLMPPYAGLVALPGGNSMLVTDTVKGVQRIVRRATSFPAFLDELVAVIDG